MLELHKIISVTCIPCPIVFILFYEQSCQGGVLEIYEKGLFFSAFSCLGPFRQDFRQVKR